MTRASAARRTRRRENDLKHFMERRLAAAKSGQLRATPDALSKKLLRTAWSEALKRASLAMSAPLKKMYRLERRVDVHLLAEIDLSSAPYVVRVGEGAPRLLYSIGRLIAARSAPMPADGTPFPPRAEADEVSYAETAERLNRAFFWYSIAGGVGVHQDFPITSDQALFAGILAQEAMIFLLCHEIGHGIIELGGFDDPDNELAADFADLPEPWRTEFLADRFGLRLALGNDPLRWRNGNLLAVTYAGFELALVLQREWERYHAHHQGVAYISSTHPAAADRLNSLRKFFAFHVGADSVDRVSSVAECVSTVFIGLVDMLLSPDFARERAARDEERIEHFRTLANECSAGIVPDYYRFLPEAQALLRQSESFALLEVALEMTACTRGEAPLEGRQFSIAKLVGRACEDLDEPYFSTFKRVTEFPDLSCRSGSR